VEAPQSHGSPPTTEPGRRSIHRGDIFWVQPDHHGGSEARIPHPSVVIEAPGDDRDTVVVCLLTSNRQRVTMPGNVLLEAGEGNLTRLSVVEVSKVFPVARSRLGDSIGTLSEQRIEQILAGMRFVQTSFFER